VEIRKENPGNHYMLGKKLGKGAYGDVNVVKNKLTEEVYAMKEVRYM